MTYLSIDKCENFWNNNFLIKMFFIFIFCILTWKAKIHADIDVNMQKSQKIQHFPRDV